MKNKFCFTLFAVILFSELFSGSIFAKENIKKFQMNFFQSKLNFPIKFSDPEETISSVRFLEGLRNLTENDESFELGLGGRAPVVSFTFSDKHNLTFYAKGLVKSRFGMFTRSFDLIHTDYFGGMSACINSPVRFINKLEFFYYHQSSHHGDDYIMNSGASPVNFSHEVMKATHYLDIINILDLSYTILFDTRKDSIIDKGRIGLQIDALYSVPIFSRSFHSAVNIKSLEINKWAPSYYFQLAYGLTPNNYSKTEQKLILEYYNGFSRLGQFYKQREEFISLGILIKL